MDTFANLVFAPNPNRTGWEIASMTWTNDYGIIVNQEQSGRIPSFPNNKYQVCVTFAGELQSNVVIPGNLCQMLSPDDVTGIMEHLQSF